VLQTFAAAILDRARAICGIAVNCAEINIKNCGNMSFLSFATAQCELCAPELRQLRFAPDTSVALFPLS